MAGYAWDGEPESETRGRPSTFNFELCGTPEGYAQHKSRKKKTCDRCREAKFITATNRPELVWETNTSAGKIDSDGRK